MNRTAAATVVRSVEQAPPPGSIRRWYETRARRNGSANVTAVAGAEAKQEASRRRQEAESLVHDEWVNERLPGSRRAFVFGDMSARR
jgi:hypothetical protein